MSGLHPQPAFDRILNWAVQRTPGPIARYALAGAIVIVVAMIRAAFVTSLLPWLLFVPAVLVIALLIGPGPGNFATFLAAGLAGHSIAPPGAPLLLTGPQWAATLMFVAIGLGLVKVTAETRAAFRRMQELVRTRDEALAQLASREAFLSSVLASSTDCITVLDPDGRPLFSNGGCPDRMGKAGPVWHELWQGEGQRHAVAALAAANAGRTDQFVGMTGGPDGTSRHWDVAVSPILSADGRADRILSVSRDITASRRDARDRLLLARIVETSADFMGMVRRDGSVFFLNDAARGLVGRTGEAADAMTILDFFPPDEARIVAEMVLPEVDRSGDWSGERMLQHVGTGEAIPVLCTLFIVREQDGSAIGYGMVMRDFRERKRAERQLRLLNDELGHRLKNSLAVVQGIVSQSLRLAATPDAARKAIGERLATLATAHDVLTQTSWNAAPLRSIVAGAVAAADRWQDRVRIAGPDLNLNARAALALAMALHELVTNAIKYGALSGTDGHVEIEWSVTGSRAEGHLHLVWRETGGPRVQPPVRTGFGSRLIGDALAADLGGAGVSRYDPSGLVWTLEAVRPTIEHL